MTILKSLVIATIIGAFATSMHPSVSVGAANEITLASRTSDESSVRVVVTPKPLVAGATAWEFDVVMDTHVKPLTEDLAKSAVLIDRTGRQYAPLGWQGDAPGGHHRKGVLRFPAPGDATRSVELRLTGIGGSATRSFRWDLK